MHIQALREAVELKFGQPIRYTKDCAQLSKVMHDQTGRVLSVSTLKRFWQLIQSPFKPSDYTLDSLSIYIGYANWEAFKENYNAGAEPSIWNKTKKIARNISDIQMYSVMQRLQTSISGLIPRHFLFIKYQKLKSNEQTATALIGISGIGKSAATIKLIQSINEDDSNNDIGIFIDTYLLLNQMNTPTRVGAWLAKQFYPLNSVEDIWQHLNDKRTEYDGKMLIVFDGLDALRYTPEVGYPILSDILDFIWHISKFKWIKAIVNCRPETWKDISYHIHQHMNQQSIWFEIQFNIQNTILPTLPELTSAEIEQIAKINQTKLNLSGIHKYDPELSDLLKHPFFLSIYMYLSKSNPEPNFIEILQHYFANYVLGGILRNEKRRILLDYLTQTQWAKSDQFVAIRNMSTITAYPSAYQELIRSGVIEEAEKVAQYLNIITHIYFSQPVYLEFIMVNEWLQRYALSDTLISRLQAFYQENNYILHRIYLWLMRYAIADGNSEVANQLLAAAQSVPNYKQIFNLSKAPTLF